MGRGRERAREGMVLVDGDLVASRGGREAY